MMVNENQFDDLMRVYVELRQMTLKINGLTICGSIIALKL